MRFKVAVAAGGGMSHEEIAIGLGISRNTLEKHFAHELSVGAYEKRIAVLEAMHSSACKGNVTAQRAYMERMPEIAPTPDEAAVEPKELKRGKKEQANADAQTAQTGTQWEGLLPGASTIQ